MGLIQIDSVNVLVRSQELPLYARLGTHPRSLIPDATADGELFEYWVHEASHVPVELHPYLRWHMNRDHRGGGVNRLFESRHGFVDEVLQRIDREGPIVAGDLKQRRGPKGTWWDWDDGKIALEYLFHRGQLAAVRRPNDFARVYDLADRVLPADVLAVPDVPEVEARKELLVRAARHHGVGTLEDLTDYHRQRNPPCRPLVPELVEDGRLVEAQVEGWDKPAYMHPDAVIPRRVEATALLSPFDPVVWNRDRTERLFGFRYRIEIYVPKAKRKYGYYVLPILIGDGLAGRVDLKADRAEGVLRVLGLFAEDHADRAAVRAAIEPELEAMSTWLGLDGGVEWRP